MFEWVTVPAINHFKALPQPVFPILAEYDFGWWYAYFWKEAKGGNAPDEAYRVLIDMLYTEPTVNVAGLGYGAANQARSAAAIAVIRAGLPIPKNDHQKRRILKQLLSMGFRAMAPTGMRTGADTRDFFKDQIRYDDIALQRRIPMAIGFRGEGRSYDRVLAQGGAQNRVDLKLLNMDQVWHPFWEPALAQAMYFRKTSGDNCLYSVTSVGDAIDLSVGFPLIEDAAIYRLPGKPLQRWTSSEAAQAASSGVRVAKIRLITGGRMLYGYTLTTDNYVYVLKVVGDAVHTQNELGGTECRERGVREIAMKDLMVAAHLKRLHCGPTRKHGVFGYVQTVKYNLGQQVWADNATDIQIGTAHFDGDACAGAVFMKLIQDTITTPPYIEGEVDDRRTQLKIMEVVDWNVAYDAWQQDVRNPEIFFVPL